MELGNHTQQTPHILHSPPMPTLHSRVPMARYQRGPFGLWWWRLLPLLAPQPQCNTPLWWWGFWRDASLHPESCLPPPVSVQVTQNYSNFVSSYSTLPHQTHFLNMLTSLTSQLTGDLPNRKADTKFFHQFHQRSLPDNHTHTDKQTQISKNIGL